MRAHLNHCYLKLVCFQSLISITLLTPVCQREPLCAQVFAVPAQAAADTNASSSQKMPGFSIPIDEKKLNLLDDYERYVRHRMWEKALTALRELSETKSNSPLLPTKDGFLVDAEYRIWQALVSLPAEGREAFRLFFDGKARKQFTDLSSQSGMMNPKTISAAKKIYAQYFLTSVGDDVADLLGNDAFERGQFSEAAHYWQSILDHHPDSNLSELELNVKLALALIRSHQRERVAESIQVISQQFPGEKVTLGGVSVDPVGYLKSLTAAEPVQTKISTNQRDTELSLLTERIKLQQTKNKPLWQVSFLDKTAAQAMVNSQSDYYGRRKSYQTFVPPMAVDQERAYFNFYGICFGVDLQTGKLVWRNEKFKTLGTRFNNYSFHQSSNMNQYHIVVHGNYVLATLIPQKEMNHYRARYRLFAYHYKTGKLLWQCNSGNESFISKPLVDGDHIYIISHTQNNKSLSLNRLSLKSGSKQWSISLGTAMSGTSSHGMPIMPVPVLQKEGDNLLVLTNNGALFEISAPTKTVNWVFRYPYQVNQQNTNYYYAPISEQTELHSEGQLLRDQNLVYFKEAGSNEVFALDLTAKRVIWKRPIKKSAQLVGIDQKNLYLMSKELEALDRKTNQLNWAVALPIAAGGLSALIAPDEVSVFTRRGIFEISKTNGDIKQIYRGNDLTSLGGAIKYCKGLVICVSNRAISAYPTESQQPPKKPAKK